VENGCSGGRIAPTPSHFLNALQMVPHSTMGHIGIPAVEGVEPSMNFRKWLAKLALAVFAMLFMARHINTCG
jgi:hypothetical protein